MKKLLHKLYKFCGHILCRVFLLYWKTRDALFPPKEDTVLFVAHPDDDTLFFHTFIKEKKPYVVLLMTGWSTIRLLDFFKVMKQYGVRCRAYDLVSALSPKKDPKWIRRLEKQVSESFKAGRFTLCATHNAEGEYGHPSHRAVHEAVVKTVSCPVLTPVSTSEIKNYPLSASVLEEKKDVFRKLYRTEVWVLDELPDWAENEKLVVCKKD